MLTEPLLAKRPESPLSQSSSADFEECQRESNLKKKNRYRNRSGCCGCLFHKKPLDFDSKDALIQISMQLFQIKHPDSEEAKTEEYFENIRKDDFFDTLEQLALRSNKKKECLAWIHSLIGHIDCQFTRSQHMEWMESKQN